MTACLRCVVSEAACRGVSRAIIGMINPVMKKQLNNFRDAAATDRSSLRQNSKS